MSDKNLSDDNKFALLSKQRVIDIMGDLQYFLGAAGDLAENIKEKGAPALSEPQQGQIRKQVLLLVKSIKKEYEEEYKKKISESIIDVNTAKDKMLNKMDYELAKELANHSMEDKKILKTLGELKEQMGKLGQTSSPVGKDLDTLDGKIDAILKITKNYKENFEITLNLVEGLAKAPAAKSTDEKTLASILQKLEKLDNIDKDAATIKHNANILVDRAGTGFKSFGLFVGGALIMFMFFAVSGKISINF